MLFFGQTPNSAVKESILQQTGCLHYGRHDIFTFFRNMGQLLYFYLKNKQTSDSVPIKAISMNFFMQSYQSKIAYRISGKNFGIGNNIKSIPLYAVFCTDFQ